MSKTAAGSRKALIMLVAVFVLPVILAKIALDNDFFNRASTNRGELLQPTLDATPLLSGEQNIWRQKESAQEEEPGANPKDGTGCARSAACSYEHRMHAIDRQHTPSR